MFHSIYFMQNGDAIPFFDLESYHFKINLQTAAGVHKNKRELRDFSL